MGRTRNGKDFDFTELSALARRDPDAFERRRAEILEHFIENAPPAHREILRRTQWHADRMRERADSPLHAVRDYWREIRHKAGEAGGGMMWTRELERMTGATETSDSAQNAANAPEDNRNDPRRHKD